MILYLFLLQSPSKPAKSVDLTIPNAPSIPAQTPFIYREPTASVQLGRPTEPTTPHLTQTSDLMTNYQVGLEVGDQRATMYELKSKVATLEEKREKSDRPDIDSLVETRRYVYWIGAVVGGVLGFLWWAKGFIWEDTIKPRLRRELTVPPQIPSDKRQACAFKQGPEDTRPARDVGLASPARSRHRLS
jgi:hypothetical protein